MIHWRVYAARLFPGLVLAQALHRFEEFVSGSYEFVPLVPLPRELFALASLSYFLLLLALIPSVSHRRRWAIWLGGFAALVEIVNGAIPLLAVPVQGAPLPGAWTAPILLGFAVGYLTVTVLAARKGAAIRESVRPQQETPSG